MPFGKNRRIGLAFAALLGIAVLDTSGHAQDAAWEGLITAGRSALQQQNYAEAERHFESALQTAERFSSDDPRLGKSFNNLAAVYYAQEDFARAEPLMRRALAQLRQALGPENTEVAQTMKNLAALYFLQGNRSEAEALLKQALEILENVHGPNHAFVATVLSNLAGLYQAEDRYRDAEPLLTRSLAIWEGLLGPDHPDVVRSRDLLVQVREAQGIGGEGRARAAAIPRPQTPIAQASRAEAATTEAPIDDAPLAAANANPSTTPNANEVAKAANALEALTRTSREEAARTPADGVPVPALNPIGETVQAAADAAVVPRSPDGEDDQPAAEISSDLQRNSNEIIQSALEEAAATPDEAATATATAILNEAASAEDVSYAVYLSSLWSIDEARRYWRAMQDAMPDVLRGKQMEIEAVAAGDGGDPFYRVLTAPFPSDPAAQTACDQIRKKLRTHDCTVVVREAVAGG